MLEEGTIVVGDACISIDDVRGNNYTVISYYAGSCVVLPDDDTTVSLTPYQMITLANWLTYHADKILKGNLT